MKGLRIFGEYIVEIVVVTLLMALSAATVIMFIPMVVGMTGFFKNKKDVRLFRDIFLTMKENWKILIPYTIFELLIIIFPVLNIYFFNTHLDKMNYFLLAVSYIALVVGGIYLTTAPTIIVNMNINFFQLLRNGFMLLFGGLFRSIASVAVIGGILALVLLYPYVIPATLYLAPLLTSKLMLENFYVLKARALGTSVYAVKQEEQNDDYLDERGMVKHAEEQGGEQ
jgi:hypothetical protein